MPVNALRRHKKFIVYLILALVLFSAGAAVLTWPLVSNPNRYYFNVEQGHDAIGTMSLLWEADQGVSKGNSTKFFGYPFGVNTGGYGSYLLSADLMKLLVPAVGPRAAYNLFVLSAFPIAGLAMFLLIYYLTLSGPASILSGFLYAFSPWLTVRVFDQVTLAGIYCLPIFVLALLYFRRRKDVFSALLVAASAIVAILIDIHFGVFCVLLALAFSAAVRYLDRREKSGPVDREARKESIKKTALLVILIVVLVVAVTAPLNRNVLYKDPDVFAGGNQRGIDETVSYSAHPWNYFVPPAYSFLWRGLTYDFVEDHLGKTGIHEVTSYPGIVTVLLGLVAAWYYFRRKKHDVFSQPARSDNEETENRRARRDTICRVILFSMITIVAAFILSMPPLVKIGGASIPTPSIVMRVFAPLFRFYSRWALLVTFGFCLLAGLGFALLVRARAWNRSKTAVACVALIALFCLDVAIVPPWRSKDISRPPAIVSSLARLPQDQPVAVYPVNPGLYQANLWYMYYQIYHKHPMLNGVKAATVGDQYSMVLKDIYSPYTPRMLSKLGIRYVMVLDDFFKQATGQAFDPSRMPVGYDLVDKTADGYLYRVVSPPAQVAPLFDTNFTPSTILEDGKAWTVMRSPTSEMALINNGPDAVYDFSLDYIDPDGRGTLTASLDGRQLARLGLEPGNSSLSLTGMKLSRGRHILRFNWTGNPASIDGRVFRTDGNVEGYLLFSRPSLKEVE